MKTVFKIGDKVFHYSYGWGEIIDLLSEDEWVKIRFKDAEFAFIGYNYISFTEYTLQGFSQERPIELPEVGELCLVRDYDTHEWKCRVYFGYDSKSSNSKFLTDSGEAFMQLKRIKILD